VKICGLSTSEAVEAAVDAGADAVGFVFAPSPRLVTAQLARELGSIVPPGVERVGVFRKQSIDEVLQTAREANLTTIQLHGYEPLEDVERAKHEGYRVLRAFGIDEYGALTPDERSRWDEERLLVDAVEPGGGVPFDPAELETRTPRGWWLLAGGLTPGNVRELIERLRPSGVDVSSGVEVERGVKSVTLIRQFVNAAKQAG